jgi:ABC-type dipeptide/oligopeptide/nickel transport system ATPase component
MDEPHPILSIRDLGVEVADDNRRFPVLDGFSLDVPRARTLALLGESGSGKTLAALAVLGLLPRAARVTAGRAEFGGTDLLALDESSLRRIRGSRIGVVFQETGTALNPLMPVGLQIGEPLRVHQGLGAAVTRQQVLSLLEIVGIADPEQHFRSYPHQLSGGARQRSMIAMALACRPELLVADEPTTALDATVQAQILDLLTRLIRDLRMSVLLITHDLAVVTHLADSVAVLHSGRVVEEGPVSVVLGAPAHPYTAALLEARPGALLGAGHRQIAALARGRPGIGPPGGCPLAGSCGRCGEAGAGAVPPMIALEDGRRVRCFFAAPGGTHG